MTYKQCGKKTTSQGLETGRKGENKQHTLIIANSFFAASSAATFSEVCISGCQRGGSIAARLGEDQKFKSGARIYHDSGRYRRETG